MHTSPQNANRTIPQSANRKVAESIVKERSGIRLIETIEYYLNELDRLENKGAS